MHAAKSAPSGAFRTLGHRLEHGMLFVRHRSTPPTDGDWRDMVTDIGRQLQAGQTLQILVMTDDAGPNAVQRNELNQLVKSRGGTLRVAVMSSSRLVRGIVTAFSWMGTMQIRALEPGDFAPALAFLQAPHVSVAAAARVFAELDTAVR